MSYIDELVIKEKVLPELRGLSSRALYSLLCGLNDAGKGSLTDTITIGDLFHIQGLLSKKERERRGSSNDSNST